MVLSQGRTKPRSIFWHQLLEVTRTLCIILCIFFSCVYNQFQWRGLCFGSYSQARQLTWLHFQTSWLAKCQSRSRASLCTPISYNWPQLCVFPESTCTAANTNQTPRSQTRRSEKQIFLSPQTTSFASWHSFVRPKLDKSSKSHMPRTESEVK